MEIDVPANPETYQGLTLIISMAEPLLKPYLKLLWGTKHQLSNLPQNIRETFSKVFILAIMGGTGLVLSFLFVTHHNLLCFFISYMFIFTDIADGLVGVGLITQSEDMPGMLQLDKGHNDMSKFLNRILGMKVEKQNLLFKYFADTLNATINQAKRSGKYDQGILDVGLTDEHMVELVKTHTFVRKHATGKAKIELHVLTVERGLSWDAAKDKGQELVGNPSEEGFYLSHQVRNIKKIAILAAACENSSRYKALADKSEKGSKKRDKVFIVYRPNTGQQVSSHQSKFPEEYVA